MWKVLLLFALFASVFTIAKTGLDYSQPFFLVGSRMALAGFLMLGYQFLTDKGSLRLNRADFLKIFLLGLFSIYLTNILEFWGLKYLTSFKTCFIYSLSPFVSALFSYFLFKESISLKKWLGLLVGVLGFIPLLMHQTASEEMTGQFLYFSWAELAVIGAAVASVYGWILLYQLVRDSGRSPIVANGYSMVVGGAMALVHSLAVETWDPIPVSSFWPFAGCALLLILVSNLICYNLYGSLLKRFSATFMSFAGFTTPFFTAFFGWLYLGEVVAWPFYLSSAIVLSGLLIFYQDELRAPVPVPEQG